MSFSLYLRRTWIDSQTGEHCEDDPVYLHLQYDTYEEAKNDADILEQVYGKGRISIEQDQEYQARMGRY